MAAVKLTPRERVEYRAARALSYLPARAMLKLSGKAAVRLDGQTLDPEIQMTLALLEKRGDPDLETLPPVQGRAQTRRQAQVFAGREVRVGSVRDLTVPGPDGPLPARHYAPPERSIRTPAPLLVFFHGGGFVIGDLETHDVTCRIFCRHAGVHVLAIDYRLAPEHPWPAPVEDAVAATRWALANAGELGADPDRVAVGGDSAGGNLAAVACQVLVAEDGPSPAAQLLLYPTTDAGHTGGSAELFAEGFFLTKPQMDWFTEQYLGTDYDATDPRISPMVGRLEGLPPVVLVTAGFDPLRDEGERYAAALRDAGVPVVLRRFEGMIHGFVNMTAASHAARDATVEIAGTLRGVLATVDVPRPQSAEASTGSG
jgi:acetyl esterase